MGQTGELTAPLIDYIARLAPAETATMRRCREETSALGDWALDMQIAPEQAAFMKLIVALMAARSGIEIGVFHGYSALWLASALPCDGRLVACEYQAERLDRAQTYWRAAGLADRIEPRLGPACATLEALIAGGEEGCFDFAFIDADKGGYPDYFELCYRLLRPNGLIMFDNMLWSGRILDAADSDPDTLVLRQLNLDLSRDPRVESTMIPIGDGVLLCRKS